MEQIENLEKESMQENVSEDTKKPEVKLTKKHIVIIFAVVIAVAVSVIGSQYIFVGGKMYPSRTEILDLRTEEITVEEYVQLAERLPQCDIIWNVPFQNGFLDSKTQEITVTNLTDEDIRMLDYVTELKIVHAENCDDYLALAQLQQRFSGIDVRYTVPVAGKRYAKDTETLELSSITQEDVQRMPALLQLRKVAVDGCEDYDLLQQLQKDYPQWNLTYMVNIGDQSVAWDTPAVQLENVSFPELERAMPGLPKLKQMDITNPLIDAQDLLSLRSQYPDVKLNWTVELYGQTLTEDVTEVDISGNLVEDYREVEKLVACLPNLEKLIMSDCGIDNEIMAEFRQRQRANYKVVWTVYLGNVCVVRTDATTFMPYQLGEGYFTNDEAVDLKYCEDMICIDLGHHYISNIDFLRSMPHLKYLILAHTKIKDISAIAECKELIYLEIDWTRVKDLTPLTGLTKLEDLNLNMTQCDVTPILGMTWLKNLWVPFRSDEVQQQIIEALPNTNLELVQSNTKGWRHLPNYYAQRDLLGMEYMNQ